MPWAPPSPRDPAKASDHDRSSSSDHHRSDEPVLVPESAQSRARESRAQSLTWKHPWPALPTRFRHIPDPLLPSPPKAFEHVHSALAPAPRTCVGPSLRPHITTSVGKPGSGTYSVAFPKSEFWGAGAEAYRRSSCPLTHTHSNRDARVRCSPRSISSRAHPAAMSAACSWSSSAEELSRTRSRLESDRESVGRVGERSTGRGVPEPRLEPPRRARCDLRRDRRGGARVQDVT